MSNDRISITEWNEAAQQRQTAAQSGAALRRSKPRKGAKATPTPYQQSTIFDAIKTAEQEQKPNV
jgi:hypothetical protein